MRIPIASATPDPTVAGAKNAVSSIAINARGKLMRTIVRRPKPQPDYSTIFSVSSHLHSIIDSTRISRRKATMPMLRPTRKQRPHKLSCIKPSVGRF